MEHLEDEGQEMRDLLLATIGNGQENAYVGRLGTPDYKRLVMLVGLGIVQWGPWAEGRGRRYFALTPAGLSFLRKLTSG